MAISRGASGSGNGSFSSLSLPSALGGASIGSLCVLSITTSLGVSHSYPAGWTVLYNTTGGLNQGSTASLASKVLTSGDLSSGAVTFGSNVVYDYAFVTYNGSGPSLDPSGSAYGQSIPGISVETTNVSATPSLNNDWLVGILIATSVSSPTVTGSVSLVLQQNGIFYSPGPVIFDSNGTVPVAALTESFSTGGLSYFSLAAFLVSIRDATALTVTPAPGAVEASAYAPLANANIGIVPSTAGASVLAFPPAITTSASTVAHALTGAASVAAFQPTASETGGHASVIPEPSAVTAVAYQSSVSSSMVVTPLSAGASAVAHAASVSISAHVTVTPAPGAVEIAAYQPTGGGNGGSLTVTPILAVVAATGSFAPPVTSTRPPSRFPARWASTRPVVSTTFAPPVTSTRPPSRFPARWASTRPIVPTAFTLTPVDAVATPSAYVPTPSITVTSSFVASSGYANWDYATDTWDSATDIWDVTSTGVSTTAYTPTAVVQSTPLSVGASLAAHTPAAGIGPPTATGPVTTSAYGASSSVQRVASIGSASTNAYSPLSEVTARPLIAGTLVNAYGATTSINGSAGTTTGATAAIVSAIENPATPEISFVGSGGSASTAAYNVVPVTQPTPSTVGSSVTAYGPLPQLVTVPQTAGVSTSALQPTALVNRAAYLSGIQGLALQGANLQGNGNNLTFGVVTGNASVAMANVSAPVPMSAVQPLVVSGSASTAAYQPAFNLVQNPLFASASLTASTPTAQLLVTPNIASVAAASLTSYAVIPRVTVTPFTSGASAMATVTSPADNWDNASDTWDNASDTWDGNSLLGLTIDISPNALTAVTTANAYGATISTNSNSSVTTTAVAATETAAANAPTLGISFVANGGGASTAAFNPVPTTQPTPSTVGINITAYGAVPQLIAGASVAAASTTTYTATPQITVTPFTSSVLATATGTSQDDYLSGLQGAALQGSNLQGAGGNPSLGFTIDISPNAPIAAASVSTSNPAIVIQLPQSLAGASVSGWQPTLSVTTALNALVINANAFVPVTQLTITPVTAGASLTAFLSIITTGQTITGSTASGFGAAYDTSVQSIVSPVTAGAVALAWEGIKAAPGTAIANMLSDTPTPTLTITPVSAGVLVGATDGRCTQRILPPWVRAGGGAAGQYRPRGTP